MRLQKRTDRGVAGLTILLSLVVFLFVIGLLVSIFALMGGSLGNSTAVSEQYTGASVDQNSSILGTSNISSVGSSMTTCASASLGALNTVVLQAQNGTVIGSGNYTTSACVVTMVTTSGFNNSEVNVTYDYTYAGESFTAINDTTSAISDVTDWFSIFIVIGAMVVLILLTVIIITAIRGSGLIGGQTA